jgi:hypothetical protein
VSLVRGSCTGLTAIGGAVTTAPRSTATSIVATPRTGAAPQATTVRRGRFDGTPATSKRSRYSTSVWAGLTSWKSLSASPTNSSILLSPVGADARPRTVTWPANVAPGVGSTMLTTPASGPLVGQVLGMAPAGAAGPKTASATKRSSRRAVTCPTLVS